MDPSVYAYMYKKEIEEEERQKSTEVEKAPEGVPVLTLFDLYESARTDIESPRKMDGQTVYFDDEHHPISVMVEDEDYNLPDKAIQAWAEEVERFNQEIKASTPKVTPAPSEKNVLANSKRASRKPDKSKVTTVQAEQRKFRLTTCSLTCFLNCL